jgi:hypothetical protein
LYARHFLEKSPQPPFTKGGQGGILWADFKKALAGRLMSTFLSR